MRRLEIVFKQDDQAILVPGDKVDAAYWDCDDDAVVLLDAGMVAVARGPVGQLGRSVLPRIDQIKVFAVGAEGVTHMKSLPRATA